MNLILSPHLDDAALSLGGLLSKEGATSVVATFFAGTPQSLEPSRWDRKCGFTDSAHAMNERLQENARSLGLLGVLDGHIRNYEHLDLEYRSNPSNSQGEEQDLTDSLIQEISTLVQEFSSLPLKVFIPSFEVHRDHALIKRAALEGMRTDAPSKQFFMYQDIPYAFKLLEEDRSRFFWNYYSRKSPHTWRYSVLKNKLGGTTDAVSPFFIPLTNADLQKKIAAIAAYTSQVPHLGKDVLKTTEEFASAQAKFFSIDSPYCEVAYKIM